VRPQNPVPLGVGKRPGQFAAGMLTVAA
jgi:hypothetical protein